MRDFLLANGQLAAIAIVGTEAIFTLILLIMAIAKKKAVIWLMFLISLGITFDAAVIAFGTTMPDDLLQILSKARYTAHGLLLPLTLTVCGYVLKWEYTIGIKLCWVLSILLCGAGAAAGWFRETELISIADITRYAPTDATPEWAQLISKALSYGTVIPLLLAGLWNIIKSKNPAIFLGGACMLGFSLLGPLTDNRDLIFLISMGGECLLLLFYVIHAATACKIDKGLL